MRRAVPLLSLVPLSAVLAAAAISCTCGSLPASASAPPPPGLSVGKDGALLRGGRPYRGVGVNFFDAFARAIKTPGDTSYDASFGALEQRGIPFARFMCGGFWPIEMRLYREDPKRYLELLDGVVQSAERHRVGLIPSLFWNLSAVPDLVGEPCDQWGNPQSKTHAFMRQYVRDVVGRYRQSPAIWAWEFGNEYNLGADLPNASEHRPPVWPNLGTATSRSARDELTHAAIRTAFAAFAREVRRYDPVRAITSGNGFPRPSAWHQLHERSWTADTPEQNAEMLAGDNPDPMDLLSVHAYDDYERIGDAMTTAKAVRKPLFVGEFGVPGADTAANRRKFASMLDLIERQRVPLAALWVFDFGSQDDWSVTPINARSWQLDAVGQANSRIRADRTK